MMVADYLITDIGRCRLKKALKSGSFLALFILIFTLLIIFILALVDNVGLIQLISLLTLGLLLSSLAYWVSNRAVLTDIKREEVVILTSTIQAKHYKEEFSKSVGSSFSDGLGDLIPLFWHRKKTKLKLHILIINNQPYRINVELYKRVTVGMEVKLVFSKQAKIYLDILVDTP